MSMKYIYVNEKSGEFNLPAVNSVPANSAVLKNDSRSPSCVTDWRRVQLAPSSTSAECYIIEWLSGCSHEKSVTVEAAS